MPRVILGKRHLPKDVFFAQSWGADNWQIVTRIDKLAEGGGAATQVWNLGDHSDDVNDALFLACASSQKVVQLLEYSDRYGIGSALAFSNDGGKNFDSYDFNVPNWGIGFTYNYWKLFLNDLSDPKVIWIATQIGDGNQPQTWHESILYSIDGGEHWTEFNASAANPPPGGYHYFQSFVVPLHNGSEAYCVWIWATPIPDRHYWMHVYKFKTDGTYTFYDDGGAIDSALDLASVTPTLDRAAISTDDPSTFFIASINSSLLRDLWAFDWNTKAWTQKVSDIDSDCFLRQIQALPSGRVFIFSAGYGAKIMRFTYSDDGWATHTVVDLNDYIELAEGVDWFYVGRGARGTLCIVLADGSCLFSLDDGATWKHTAVIVATGGGGIQYDLCGNGGF